MSFQIAIYHPVLSNNCNNIFLQFSAGIVIFLELFSERSNHMLHSLHQASSIKNINIRLIQLRCISTPRSWSHIKNTVVDFPTHSMFTFHECWSSLGTSILENSSSTANNTWSRLPSILPFCFLWLCNNFVISCCYRQLNKYFLEYTLSDFCIWWSFSILDYKKLVP